jgi:hypothetical protein
MSDILEPIDQQIVKFQKDSVPMSDVYDCWTMLASRFNNIVSLFPAQLKYIKDKVEDRWNFIYGDAHGLGYLALEKGSC